MLDTPESNVKEKVENRKENVNSYFKSEEDRKAYEEQMEKIRVEVLQKFREYKTTLNYMAADASIEVLCLPKPIEKILLANKILRIYDFFDVDLTKIKGLGVIRIRQLAASLDQFFSML